MKTYTREIYATYRLDYLEQSSIESENIIASRGVFYCIECVTVCYFSRLIIVELLVLIAARGVEQKKDSEQIDRSGH